MLPTALNRLYRPPTECHPFRYQGCGHHGDIMSGQEVDPRRAALEQDLPWRRSDNAGLRSRPGDQVAAHAAVTRARCQSGAVTFCYRADQPFVPVPSRWDRLPRPPGRPGVGGCLG